MNPLKMKYLDTLDLMRAWGAYRSGDMSSYRRTPATAPYVSMTAHSKTCYYCHGWGCSLCDWKGRFPASHIPQDPVTVPASDRKDYVVLCRDQVIQAVDRDIMRMSKLSRLVLQAEHEHFQNELERVKLEWVNKYAKDKITQHQYNVELSRLYNVISLVFDLPVKVLKGKS